MTPDPNALLALAVEAGEAAGALLLDGLHRTRTDVTTKSSSTDMVSEMDRAAEATIARVIRAARPLDGFLAEEGVAAQGFPDAEVRWVVDPLDGTTNYLYGLPAWSVSIAAEVGGEVVAGVVVDPTQAETFTAVAGGGAACNGRPLRVGQPPDLARALVATGFGYDAAQRGRQAADLARLLPEVRDVRRAGAASLDLCWVACGRLDAYYEQGLQPWDWAAGTLVATEAGAIVAATPDRTLVAAAPPLHGHVLELFARLGIAGVHR